MRGPRSAAFAAAVLPIALLVVGCPPDPMPPSVPDCVVDDDCDSGEVCQNDVCVAQPECTTDADCDDGDACNGAETCTEQMCQAGVPVECNDDESCVDGECQAIAECAVDEDCPEGEACNDGTCEPAADCETDDDCTLGNVCTDGSCVADSSPQMELGITDEDTGAFIPLIDGGTIPLLPGFQGGQHILPTIRATGFAENGDDPQCFFQNPSPGDTCLTVEQLVFTFPEGEILNGQQDGEPLVVPIAFVAGEPENVIEVERLIFINGVASELDGETVILSLTLKDRNDESIFVGRILTLTLDFQSDG